MEQSRKVEDDNLQSGRMEKIWLVHL